MDNGTSVLIVDSQEETREVLRSALERRGVRILTSSQPQQGLELARRHTPDLIVLDLECEPASTSAVRDGFAQTTRRHDTPLVLLGSASRRPAELPDGEIVSKPYHYGPLIRKIEELLDLARPCHAPEAPVGLEPDCAVAVCDSRPKPGGSLRA